MNTDTSPLIERLAPVAPELFVTDVDESIAFYERLGFRTLRAEPHGARRHHFAVLQMGEVELMLAHQHFSHRPLAAGERGQGLEIRIMVRDIDAQLARVKAAGANIVMAIDDRSYGLRDFKVADPDGFVMRFASVRRD